MRAKSSNFAILTPNFSLNFCYSIPGLKGVFRLGVHFWEITDHKAVVSEVAALFAVFFGIRGPEFPR